MFLPSPAATRCAAGTAVDGPRYISAVLVLRTGVGAVAIAVIADALLGAGCDIVLADEEG